MSIYGVSTANPFALLDEDYKPEPIPTEDTPDEKTRPTQTTRPPPQSDRRGRGRGRGGRRGEGGGPRAHTEEGEFGGDSRASRAGRFGRGNRGGAPVFRGKREYDRRDGTGRGHELEKRHGGGKGNWGVSTELEFNQTDELNTTGGGQSPEDVASPALDPTSEGDGGVKTEPTEEAPEGEDSVEKKEQEEVKIEEKQVYTLAEYEEMMKKEESVKMVPSKKEVPAVDTKQFDGMAVLKKAEEGSGFEALEVERIRKKKEKREKEVSTVEVFFKVGEPVRRSRGRGRGGRSRDFDGDSPGQKWSNGTGPSVQDVPRHDQSFTGGGGYPPSRGRRGRRGRGGRASYGEQASRQSGPQGVDISSENTFPALS